MSLPLISHNEDLLALVREGYSITIVEGHLVVDDLPFVKDGNQLDFGRMVTPLHQSGGQVLKPNTHVMYWAGPEPRDEKGDRLSCYHSEQKSDLAPGLTVDYKYSSKIVNERGKKRAYESYHEMVSTYAKIFCGPASAIDSSQTPRVFKPIQAEEGDTSPFAYPDTSAIRSGIVSATARFSDQEVGLIGLGGTGAYILDLLAKTRVKRIVLFDDDYLLQHNAFRVPGAVPFEALSEKVPKVEYFRRVYAEIHQGIEANPVKVTEDNLQELNSANFIFVAIDHGPSRSAICKHLDERGIAYIDVGLGVELLEDDSLTGQIRTTVATHMRREHIAATVPMTERTEEDDYRANIQVSDLNALNACMAVVRWKRYVGFYKSTLDEHQSLFRLRDGAHVRSQIPGQDVNED